MPTTEGNKAEIATDLKKQASKNSVRAASMEATAGSLGDILMDSVRDYRASAGVSKLATDRGNVMGQMVTEPARIREVGTTEGTRMDPLDVDYFTSKERGQNQRTLGTIAQQSKENEGTLQEIIQAGANQLMGKAQMLKAEAAKAEADANALMEQLYYEQSEKKREFDEWATLEGMKNKGGGGSKSGIGSLPDDLSDFINTFEGSLSPEDRIAFEERLSTLGGLGLSDEDIMARLRDEFSAKRFTPEQTATIASWSNPKTKGPSLLDRLKSSFTGMSSGKSASLEEEAKNKGFAPPKMPWER